MSKSSKQISEIDRLIELASEDRPGTGVASAKAETSLHPLPAVSQKDAQPSMWRVLLQLRVLLPYLVKVLPLVERGLLGTNITGAALAGQRVPSSTAGGVNDAIASIGDGQRDLHNTLRAQAGEFQLLQERVTSLNKLVEKDVLLNEDLAGSVAALRKLVTTSVVVIVSVLVVLIALMVFAIVWRLVRIG